LTLTSIDPATYRVDAMRHVILGVGSKLLELDIGVLVVFSVLLGADGTISFSRMKAVYSTCFLKT
jgi:hypothetical protein